MGLIRRRRLAVADDAWGTDFVGVVVGDLDDGFVVAALVFGVDYAVAADHLTAGLNFAVVGFVA